MENQGIIDKIKSNYIIKDILSYIKDNKIKLKLFIYSKYLQNKLNIKYADAKEKYLKNIGFNINEYLYIEEKKYKKNILKKNLINLYWIIKLIKNYLKMQYLIY